MTVDDERMGGWLEIEKQHNKRHIQESERLLVVG